MTVRVLILAGSRPRPDPLLEGTGLSSKALLPIAGLPMLARVLQTVKAAPEVGAVTVAAQDTRVLSEDPIIGAVAQDVIWQNSSGSIADAVASAIGGSFEPLLVTTADNVLLTPAMLAQFIADARGHDVAVALVERRGVAAAGYSTRRTWLKFRGGQWSGANLFWLGGRQALPLVEFWRSLEQDRKKGMRIVGALGPGLLVAALLRLIDIHGFAARVARRFGLRAKVVPMQDAAACIDADKPSDIPVIEAILAARQVDASALSTAAQASASSSE